MPDRLAHKVVEGLADLAEWSFDLPQQLRTITRQLERGEMTVTTHHEGLDEALAQLNQAANRLAMSILLAALIIGLGILMLIYHPPAWVDWGGWFFGLSFLLAVVLGAGLLWSIGRSR
jgi:ubiquinone biosynthesis protein